MASATVMATRGAVPHYEPIDQVANKANSPYGLPIVDHCVGCKLRNGSFFCNLPPAALRALESVKHVSSYPEGALVFMEGQAARGVYIVCQGRAKLMTTNREGKTLILKIAGPGEVLGLHSVVAGTAHELTVETLQPCQLAFISREDMLRLLKEHGDVCLRAAQHISRDCQSAVEVIRAIGLSHSVSEKLAKLLLQWLPEGNANGGEVRAKLALTHEEIAQLIGASRETVTRTLGDFKKQQVAELSGSTLLVKDRAALEDIAGVQG
jgi:CRP/FNR family transcriptional regulator, cyclic AMP receptor protein